MSPQIDSCYSNFRHFWVWGPQAPHDLGKTPQPSPLSRQGALCATLRHLQSRQNQKQGTPRRSDAAIRYSDVPLHKATQQEEKRRRTTQVDPAASPAASHPAVAVIQQKRRLRAPSSSTFSPDPPSCNFCGVHELLRPAPTLGPLLLSCGQPQLQRPAATFVTSNNSYGSQQLLQPELHFAACSRQKRSASTSDTGTSTPSPRPRQLATKVRNSLFPAEQGLIPYPEGLIPYPEGLIPYPE